MVTRQNTRRVSEAVQPRPRTRLTVTVHVQAGRISRPRGRVVSKRDRRVGTSGDRYPPSAIHRARGVEQQVDERLLELMSVPRESGEIRRDLRNDVHLGEHALIP